MPRLHRFEWRIGELTRIDQIYHRLIIDLPLNSVPCVTALPKLLAVRSKFGFHLALAKFHRVAELPKKMREDETGIGG